MINLTLVLYVVAALNLVFGGLVLLYGLRKRPNLYFFLLTVLLALWAIFHGNSIMAANDSAIMFWMQMIMLPGFLLPWSFLRFSQELAASNFRRQTVFNLIHFSIMVGFLLILFDSRFLGTTKKAVWGVEWSPGPFYVFYAIYFTLTMGHGLWILLRKIMKTKAQNRLQLMYVFLGALVSIGSAFVVNIIQPIIGVTSFNKYGPLGTVVLVSFLTYAILKHRLMDIRIFIRRAALLIGVYAILLSIGGGIVVLVHRYHLGSSPQLTEIVLLEALTLAITLSVGPFLYAYLIRRSSYFHEHELAGITHDLKSPLGSIHGALDVLENLGQGKTVAEKDVEYVRMIRRNATKLEEAVNNLLTVFKLPTKANAFEYKTCDLGELVKSAAEKYREGIDAKGLKLEINAPQSGPMVNCDEPKIRQVISNLLANALKYTSAGGIRIVVENREAAARVTIQDTGEGIPVNELPRVFDRLFQGESSRKLKGSGLGLTIAKTWVEAHGGEIHAESDGPGKGSRFWFTLPK